MGSVSYCRRWATPRVMMGEHRWTDFIPTPPEHKQLHFYANVNALRRLNKRYGTQFSYHELWKELFKPSSLLENTLRQMKVRLPQNYVSLCFRHYNAFGDTPEAYFKPISKEAQQELLRRCKERIKTIQDETGLPALVTSDSLTFLQEVASMEGVHTVVKTQKIVHMDYDATADITSYLQSFVDFWLLAGGTKIIQLSPPPHCAVSGFAFLAAQCFEKKYERIVITAH